jgi:hypothetical protein
VSTVVVSGAIANKLHRGGSVWTRLSYALGLRRLGFRVVFVEQIGREGCVGADGALVPFRESENLAYFRRVVEAFGLAGHAALVFEGGEETWGLPYPELIAITEGAALLVNISGHLTSEPLLRRFRRKAYVDQDPGFTQFWHAAGTAGSRLAGHDVYFTVGENIGAPECPIPTGGIRWWPTRQPVVLDEWPVVAAPEPGRFTTIASWRGPYGPVEHDGRVFGLKVHQFRRFLELPVRADGTFELALDIHPADEADRAALLDSDWRIVEPGAVAGSPEAFRRYVQGSGAEFSVAQGIYVDTESGWFSDRTTRYLASGKPALVQETGFSQVYPVGEGLLSFRTLEEAVDGVARIARGYDGHCWAARALAEEYFDSDRVLSRLVDQALGHG